MPYPSLSRLAAVTALIATLTCSASAQVLEGEPWHTGDTAHLAAYGPTLWDLAAKKPVHNKFPSIGHPLHPVQGRPDLLLGFWGSSSGFHDPDRDPPIFDRGILQTSATLINPAPLKTET